MTFSQIVGALMAGAFDGYLVDLRLGQATYYLHDGEGVEGVQHAAADRGGNGFARVGEGLGGIADPLPEAPLIASHCRFERGGDGRPRPRRRSGRGCGLRRCHFLITIGSRWKFCDGARLRRRRAGDFFVSVRRGRQAGGGTRRHLLIT